MFGSTCAPRGPSSPGPAAQASLTRAQQPPLYGGLAHFLRHSLSLAGAVPKRWYQALAAAAASFVPYLAGWRGTDWAAHVYRAGEVAHNGLALWDPGWYAGTFPLGYSLLYPVLAAYLGAWPVALASAAVSAYCFDALLSRGSGGYRSLSSCYFALSTVVEVAIGQLPTLAAEAFGLGCVLCLSRRWAGQADRGQTARAWRAVALGIGVGLGMLAGLTSPVAGVFVALSLGAWGLSIATEPGHQLLDRRAVTLAGAGVAVLAATLALPLLFPTPGYFPFLGGDLVAVLAVCALLACPWLRAARPVRSGAVLYALASVVFFVVPTTMGDNDIRFAAYIGVPLVLYYLPGTISRLIAAGLRSRLSAAAGGLTVTAVLVGWHWAPVASAVGGAANGPSSGPAFYQPLMDELTSLTAERPVRIEAPRPRTIGNRPMLRPTSRSPEAGSASSTSPMTRSSTGPRFCQVPTAAGC